MNKFSLFRSFSLHIFHGDSRISLKVDETSGNLAFSNGKKVALKNWETSFQRALSNLFCGQELTKRRTGNRGMGGGVDWTNTFRNLDKSTLQFDKYIWPSGQIHFACGTNLFTKRRGQNRGIGEECKLDFKSRESRPG